MDKKDRKILIYKILCVTLSIAALLLSCLRWYMGLAAAIASVVFAFIHGKNSEKNDRLVICGVVIAVCYIFVYVLVFVIGASYFSNLDISPFKEPKN
ncbi:MAG: hypothetical protein II133_06255 [Lachnospiraceae bacterium]|nr:hypothetical protein [Lachnospiraceae bacterium]